MNATIKLPRITREEGGKLNGIGVMLSYYTAPFKPNTADRYFGAVNHGSHYVFSGDVFGLERRVLVGSGNSFIKLSPAACSIYTGPATEIDLDYYGVKRLVPETERKIIEKLGLYREADSELVALYNEQSPTQRLLEGLRAGFWDEIFKEAIGLMKGDIGRKLKK